MADINFETHVQKQNNEKINEKNVHTYLEETFYILSKKNSVFRVRLTSIGLILLKESDDGSSKEQRIPLQDIVGSKCMRSKRKRPGAGSCVCSSLVGPSQLKVVDEDSGDLDENDISAYLYIYAYNLKRARGRARRERTTITLRFRSYDKYEDNNKEAQKWRTTIKCLILDLPITPNPPAVNDKKILILVNPKSGPGKAMELFKTKAGPILQEAEVPYDLQATKYAQYAREFVRTRNVYQWRAIVAVGGDGVLYEVINGMFERLDWQEALSEVQLGILPCGSGNGLARSICHEFNEPYATQNLIGLTMGLARGKSTPMDVVRVETKSNIMFSFLSVGWGLLSDIDVESERLRAIGGQRFTVWAVARLVGLRKYKGTVSYVRIKNLDNLPTTRKSANIPHSVSQDGALDSPDAEAFLDCDDGEVFSARRTQRVDSWYSVNSRKSTFFSTQGSDYLSVTSNNSEMRSPTHTCMHGPASRLPSLVSELPSHWTHDKGEFIMVHIAYTPFIGEDIFFAPRSRLADGVMWLFIVKSGISRSQLFSLLASGISHGTHAEMRSEHVEMIPVSAFRIVPDGSEGCLTVDGELVEYGPIQGEIFPGTLNISVPDTK